MGSASAATTRAGDARKGARGHRRAHDRARRRQQDDAGGDLPWFALGTAGMSNGLATAAVGATAAHLGDARLEHAQQALRDLPTLRARLAQMSVATESSRALLARTLDVVESADPTAPLFVLSDRAARRSTLRYRSRTSRCALVAVPRSSWTAADRAHVPRRARRPGDGADGRSARRLHRQVAHWPAAVLINEAAPRPAGKSRSGLPLLRQQADLSPG